MKKKLWLTFIVSILATNVEAVDFGLGVKSGTTGNGFDFSFGISKTVNVRLSITSTDIENETETIQIGDASDKGEIDAELDLDFAATALFFDWYVFDGGFHLTAGLFKNGGRAELTGTLLDDAIINGQPLDLDDLLDKNIVGQVRLGNRVQPYFGVGWGRKAGIDAGLSFTVDLGVAMLQPDVSFEGTLDVSSVTGNFATQADLDATLKDAERDAEDDLDNFDFFPVLSFGLNYAF